MIDATVQSAFVVLVAWLLGMLVKFANFPIDPAVINSVATALVAYIFSKLFPPAVRSLLKK